MHHRDRRAPDLVDTTRRARRRARVARAGSRNSRCRSRPAAHPPVPPLPPPISLRTSAAIRSSGPCRCCSCSSSSYSASVVCTSSGGNAADGEADVVEHVVARLRPARRRDRAARAARTPQKSTSRRQLVDLDDQSRNTKTHASTSGSSRDRTRRRRRPPGRARCRRRPAAPSRCKQHVVLGRERGANALGEPRVLKAAAARDHRQPPERRAIALGRARPSPRRACCGTPRRSRRPARRPSESATAARTVGRRSISHGASRVVDVERIRARAPPGRRPDSIRGRPVPRSSRRAGRETARRTRRSSGRRRAPAATRQPPRSSASTPLESPVGDAVEQRRDIAAGRVAAERVDRAAPARCATARGSRGRRRRAAAAGTSPTRSNDAAVATRNSPPQHRAVGAVAGAVVGDADHRPVDAVLGHRADDVRVMMLHGDLRSPPDAPRVDASTGSRDA